VGCSESLRKASPKGGNIVAKAGRTQLNLLLVQTRWRDFASGAELIDVRATRLHAKWRPIVAALVLSMRCGANDAIDIFSMMAPNCLPGSVCQFQIAPPVR